MKLSIIITHYRVKELLSACIESIYANKVNFDFEILVIDNDSRDDSETYIKTNYPEVQWVQNAENVGYSQANNLGASYAKGEYILLLNPDTLLSPSLLQNCMDFAEKQQNLGALGVRMTNKEGVFHPESKRNIPTPYNTFKKLYTTLFRKNSSPVKGYYFVELDEFSVGKVPILTGAFLLIKKKVYEEVGGFDTAYFMYGEDIDLCYTLLKHGYDNFYYGKETLLHYKGGSTVKDKNYYHNFFKAMEIFVKKYYLKKNIFTGMFLLLGLKARYYLALGMYYLKIDK